MTETETSKTSVKPLLAPTVAKVGREEEEERGLVGGILNRIRGEGQFQNLLHMWPSYLKKEKSLISQIYPS